MFCIIHKKSLPDNHLEFDIAADILRSCSGHIGLTSRTAALFSEHLTLKPKD
uniref:Uncharacterized protein n=1 Tax=Anguilla anguilla TaxID=7936 RepID=A0A0E9R136_ANGAN